MDSATRTSDAMSVDQREQFDRDGYLVLPGVLGTDEVERARGSLERAYAAAETTGGIDREGALHQLGAVASCPDLAFLLDHPRTLALVWSLLGWNVHVYHSHVDVHPRVPEPREWWAWHQDGGRQNRELESSPRPRLSVKIVYWLSDLTEVGRGNLMVIPGSHRTDWLPGPPRRDVPFPEPAGAVQVAVAPGDALLFDRRLWHCRSINRSDVTRYAAFFGYTLRWIASREELSPAERDSDWWRGLNPVQQQLLGGAGDESGDHRWGHYPQQVALYRHLRDGGHLNRAIPALIPDAADAGR